MIKTDHWDQFKHPCQCVPMAIGLGQTGHKGWTCVLAHEHRIRGGCVWEEPEGVANINSLHNAPSGRCPRLDFVPTPIPTRTRTLMRMSMSFNVVNAKLEREKVCN